MVHKLTCVVCGGTFYGWPKEYINLLGGLPQEEADGNKKGESKTLRHTNRGNPCRLQTRVKIKSRKTKQRGERKRHDVRKIYSRKICE